MEVEVLHEGDEEGYSTTTTTKMIANQSNHITLYGYRNCYLRWKSELTNEFVTEKFFTDKYNLYREAMMNF